MSEVYFLNDNAWLDYLVVVMDDGQEVHLPKDKGHRTGQGIPWDTLQQRASEKLAEVAEGKALKATIGEKQREGRMVIPDAAVRKDPGLTPPRALEKQR